MAETYGGKNVYLEKKLGTKPNAGGASPDKSLKMVWRHVSDLDTFTNRSGESQYFTPGANDGAWARLRYQNLGIDDMGELDGNTYEMGYSKVLQDEETEKHRLSLSGFYGKTKGHLEGYASHLTVKNTGLALYDTWKFIPSEVEMDQKPAWKKAPTATLIRISSSIVSIRIMNRRMARQETSTKASMIKYCQPFHRVWSSR